MIQIKTFLVPINNPEQYEEEMNAFLRSKKILDIKQELVTDNGLTSWNFCVKYIFNSQNTNTQFNNSTTKIDYKNVLEPPVFERFSQLREIRKQIAKEENLQPYLIFLDAELAEIAKLPEITPQTLIKIQGVGEKKVEKFAVKLIQKMAELKNNDEKRS